MYTCNPIAVGEQTQEELAGCKSGSRVSERSTFPENEIENNRAGQPTSSWGLCTHACTCISLHTRVPYSHTPHTLAEAFTALLQIAYHASADSSGATVPNIALFYLFLPGLWVIHDANLYPSLVPPLCKPSPSALALPLIPHRLPLLASGLQP